MPNARLPEILDRLTRRFERRRPVRAGSLIVTLYGDAIAPRGGSLWLGSINGLVAPFGIEPGLVRTALSRLVADGWFERNRIGKNSYYRLSKRTGTEFAAAGERIYSTRDPAWDGTLRLTVLTAPEPKDRQALREAMARAGFGQLAPNVMVRPGGLAPLTPPGIDLTTTIPLTATPPGDEHHLRRLAAGCWNLGALASAYQSLLDDIASPQRSRTDPRKPAVLDDAGAFRLRILLLHEWRRIVLHDPLLPRALLPQDWPGHPLRDAVAALYRASCAGSDRFLDVHAVNEAGPLPAASPATTRRFAL